MKYLLLTGFAFAPAILISQDVFAQPDKKYEFEFAILPSINIVHTNSECRIEPWDCGTDDDYTVISFPGASPALRMTVWSGQPWLFDIGLSALNAGERRDSYFMMEFGLGWDVAERGRKLRPFLGGLAGAISGSDPLFYAGGQLGIRYMLREHAATRAQLGYRRTLEKEAPKYRAIEIAGGLSFFL